TPSREQRRQGRRQFGKRATGREGGTGRVSRAVAGRAFHVTSNQRPATSCITRSVPRTARSMSDSPRSPPASPSDRSKRGACSDTANKSVVWKESLQDTTRLYPSPVDCLGFITTRSH